MVLPSPYRLFWASALPEKLHGKRRRYGTRATAARTKENACLFWRQQAPILSLSPAHSSATTRFSRRANLQETLRCPFTPRALQEKRRRGPGVDLVESSLLSTEYMEHLSKSSFSLACASRRGGGRLACHVRGLSFCSLQEPRKMEERLSQLVAV